MIRSLNTAERAMQMGQVRIDVLANNLANATSSGFRQIITRMAEPEAAQPGGSPAVMTADRATSGLRWSPAPQADLYHALDARPGPIQPTGRATDVAIMDRGFFEVQTPEGTRYTRNGSFVLDSVRQLTTPDGFPVAGDGGPLRIEGSSFSIGNDGTVSVDGQSIGRIKLVDFEDPSRLEHMGASLLAAPPDLAPRTLPAAETVVAQGHVEGSNVNAIDTLVAMIEAQRAFEIHSKVLQTEDQLLEKSVNNLPRVGQ